MLANYRSMCAKSTNPSQLVLPETLTLHPLYILSFLKNPAFKLLSATNLDLKIYWMMKLMSVSMEEFSYLIYPRIYEVTDIGEEVSDNHQPLHIGPSYSLCMFVLLLLRMRRLDMPMRRQATWSSPWRYPVDRTS